MLKCTFSLKCTDTLSEKNNKIFKVYLNNLARFLTRHEISCLVFFRDIDLREVDFVVLQKNNPILFLECKVSKKPKESKPLQYLKKKFPEVSCCIVYHQLEESFTDKMNIEHLCASD